MEAPAPAQGGSDLEGLDLASGRKIAALRRKHTKPEEGDAG